MVGSRANAGGSPGRVIAAGLDGGAAAVVTSGDGFGRERVIEIQRARIVVAMAQIACERDASDIAVAHVVERAGVSRRTFYELFADCEDCLLAAFDEAVLLASRMAREAYLSETKWVERVRASLTALLGFLDEQPTLARLLVVESLGCGAKVLQHRQRTLAALVGIVDEGRGEASKLSSATSVTAEGLAGAVLSVLHGRLLQREHRPLVELVNPLMSMIVLPYLGPLAARKQLARSVERPVRRAPVVGSPLTSLDMRLTYRTVRVLAAVAANPGYSNRVIGDAAGIGDQGQISKLLSRLEKLGLIENTHAYRPKGAANAWTLTERGEALAYVLSDQTARA